jgi:hypothetical protein
MLTSKTAQVVAAKLPAIPIMRRVSQAVAMLDAILMPEWEDRYYLFSADWNGSGWELAQMRNGSGDDYFIAFTPEGAFIKGFAHESAMSPWAFQPPHLWPGLTETVPAEFAECVHEPAFSMEMTTFCLWRRNHDPAWQTGPITYPDVPYADGAGDLLHLLVDRRPAAYQAWAQDYYERPVDLTEHLELKAILKRCPELQAAADHVRAFGEMLTNLNGHKLPAWIATARADSLPGLGSFAAGLERDLAAVISGLTTRWNSGPIEGRVNHIKMIERQMFGRAGLPLLRKRVLLTAGGQWTMTRSGHGTHGIVSSTVPIGVRGGA